MTHLALVLARLVARNAPDALVVVARRALGVRVIRVEVSVLGLRAVAALAGVRAARLAFDLVVACLGEVVDRTGRRIPQCRERDGCNGGHGEQPGSLVARLARLL